MKRIGILTAGITAYYMFRMLLVTFAGEYRGSVAPADLGRETACGLVALPAAPALPPRLRRSSDRSVKLSAKF